MLLLALGAAARRREKDHSVIADLTDDRAPTLAPDRRSCAGKRRVGWLLPPDRRREIGSRSNRPRRGQRHVKGRGSSAPKRGRRRARFVAIARRPSRAPRPRCARHCESARAPHEAGRSVSSTRPPTQCRPSAAQNTTIAVHLDELVPVEHQRCQRRCEIGGKLWIVGWP